MKKRWVLALVLGWAVLAPVAGEDESPSFVGQAGVGTWAGPFRDHLVRDGAYLDTPVLDAAVRLPLFPSFDLEFLVGSACVVHPRSKPIEGTFSYQGLGAGVSVPAGPLALRLGAGAGFQHGTSLLGAYSMGYAEGNAGVSGPLGGRLSWLVTLRGRVGIFPAVTIPELYHLDAIDLPLLVSLTAGLSVPF